MHFYLFVGLFVRWLDRASVWRIAILALAISWAWRAMVLVVYGYTSVFDMFVHVYQLPGMLDEFAAGIILAKLAVDGRLRLNGVYWLVGASVLGYVVMSVYWPRSFFWDVPAMVVFWHSGVALFFGLVVAAAVRLPNLTSSRIFAPFNYLGEISYGIYLWHLFALQAALHVFGQHSPPPRQSLASRLS